MGDSQQQYHLLLDQFQTLLQRSTALLHRIPQGVVDWKQLVEPPTSASSSALPSTAAPSNNNDMVDAQEEAEEEEDSSDDDDMMMLGGGYSDSEDEQTPPNEADDVKEEGEYYGDEDVADDDEEEDAMLLKRAASVHAALLLSLPTSTEDGTLGRELVEQLVNAILLAKHSSDDASSEQLASALSFVISSSSIDKRPKAIGQERWKRICLTNSLLAVQFLLHLLQHQSASALEEWNVVILPLLLGNSSNSAASAASTCSKSDSSLFLWNDALRDALLNLSSFSSSNGNASIGHQGCKRSVHLCLSALQHATSSKEVSLRQTNIIVVCQVFIRLYNGMKDADDALLGIIVKDGMQQAVLMILRGICYEQEDQAPLLTLESLRPVTGILLPRLYPQTTKDGQSSKSKSGKDGSLGAEEHEVELWKEVLMLLSPYSDSFMDVQDGGDKKRRRCKNWNQVAPMAATSILCIVLPAFRKMELPADVVSSSGKHCRPIFQPTLWNLIRDCLSKCGDSETGDTYYAGGRGISLLSRGARGDELLALSDMDEYDKASMDQLLRRRAAHMLRLMVEYERECLLKARNSSSKKNKKKGKGQQQQGGNKDEEEQSQQQHLRNVDAWMKYVLCFEMLEFETVLHLVEQVWATVKEMASEVVTIAIISDSKEGVLSNQLLPQLAWDDIGSLLCRVLLSDSPTMRKLGLYRFLSGHAGIDVTVPKSESMAGNDDVSSMGDEHKDDSTAAFMKQPKSKGGKIKKKSGDGSPQSSAPLSIVSVPFVLDVIMKSYDSIVGTKVGNNMQIEEDGQLESVSIGNLLSDFLSNYTVTLATATLDNGKEEKGDATRLSDFVNRVYGPEIIRTHKSRSLTLFYRSVATALDTIAYTSTDGGDDSNKMMMMPYIEPDNIQATIRSMRAIFSSGGAPKSMQEGLRLDMAVVLKNSKPWEKVDASLVLQVLALYPPPEECMMMEDEDETAGSNTARDALGTWLLALGNGKWSQNASSACASAFVLGKLMPFGESAIDIMSGVNSAEREVGMAICIMCTLSGNGSELLWPAVFKGLQSSVIPTVTAASSSTPGFCKANRSMILLEFGCKEGILSGMGNGDLILDKANQYMMPPPPHIESLLNNAVQFILSQLMSMTTTLFETTGGSGDASSASGGSTRSSTSHSASAYIAMLIGQLRVLHLAYPSSVTLSQAVDKMFEDCIGSLLANTIQSGESCSIHVVKYLTLSYAALSCGATFTTEGGEKKLNRLVSTCHAILGLDFSVPPGIKKEAKQACRSIFQYSKWGSLSLIVPKMMEESETQSNAEVEEVYQAILKSARESVDATPVIALPPLFECAVSAGNHIVQFDGQKTPLISSLQTIIETLFAVLEEETSSSNWTYMLNEMCALIFRGKLLLDEYESSYSKDERGPMPVMRAFEKLWKIGGTNKPHICKTIVSRISVAWLGPDEQQDSDAGLCAIPYRKQIVDLLVYKECRFDENAGHEGGGKSEKWNALPEATDSSSITRAFVLSFLSKLPPPGVMSEVVLKELVHFVVLKLIDLCSKNPAHGKAFISGSEEYARMIRSWQALCLLSRFVTEDIASDVAARMFPAMAFTLHGQIRYFMEVFTIQCTRMHPSIFGQKFIDEICRNDLTLQQVSSLMIIGGNLTVGRYSNDFFRSSVDPRMKAVLCGVLPWLSSTQGFSRAIAQLLCHQLIPHVVDVNANVSSGGEEKDDAVLRSLYLFLEGNTDMSRVRKKQQHFFDTYDVDSVCTFEGLLSIKVDEGEEANPMHMVDAIKDCLADVYKEAHGEDAPIWVQMKDLLLEADQANQLEISVDESDEIQNETELVNFQRKILPIDALDLGIRSFQEQKSFNAAGKKKQNLVVCASLVDKVPNLAGLARTCEIFSAQTLVMPNLLVRKQDDFKSISASANDWIDMEECKEEDLLNWLHKKKSEGYAIVGLEQTASSKCLTKMEFPEKTVLLLGKEKEGIPIEFLSAVDQCIEIPQLGITRSLNVHVSGAISIWEYTKQMMQQKKVG